jgi:hypothetical protein
MTENAQYVIKHNKMVLPLIAAIPQVDEQAKYKKKMYNYTTPKEAQAKEVRGICSHQGQREQ